MQLDSTLPNSSNESPLDASANDAVDRLARTFVEARPADEVYWEKMASTRVTEPATDTPEMTPPPPGLVVPFSQPPLGSTIGGYHLIEKLGEGAMGAVYRARHENFERIAALKVLFGHIANQPRLVERLYREGRALAQLDHENIVQAYGVGEDAGCHYVAMEFVDGKDLQSWLRRLGKLTVPDALCVTLAIAHGLEHAHARGVIHRDIKPENILISPAGHIKVADLGMVKTEDENMALTQTGHAIGTPWYMPLEQAKNAKDIDARSDLYALGCQLYFLLTGQPPFQGRTLVEVVQAKERGTFPTARSHNPDVPERLDLILVKMMAKLPAHRYQNATEVILDIEKLGLAGKSLSFLDLSAMEETRRNTPTPQVSDTLTDAPKLDSNIWYVKMPSSPGKHTVRKATTAQLQELLDADKVQPTVAISHHPRTGFRALSAYKEFSNAVSKVTRAAADETTSKYRELYKQIEEKEQNREENWQKQQAELDSPTRFYLETAWVYGRYPVLVVVTVGFIWWAVSAMFG